MGLLLLVGLLQENGVWCWLVVDYVCVFWYDEFECIVFQCWVCLDVCEGQQCDVVEYVVQFYCGECVVVEVDVDLLELCVLCFWQYFELFDVVFFVGIVQCVVFVEIVVVEQDCGGVCVQCVVQFVFGDLVQVVVVYVEFVVVGLQYLLVWFLVCLDEFVWMCEYECVV